MTIARADVCQKAMRHQREDQMRVTDWGVAVAFGSLAIGLMTCSERVEETVGQQAAAAQIQRELDGAALSDPATSTRVRPVRPVLKCVERLGSDQLRAHFGYVNSSSTTISIPVGFFNRFVPPPLNRGQPTSFAPGVADDVIQVAFGGAGTSIWVLGQHFAVATRFSPPCLQDGIGGRGVGGSGNHGGFSGGTGGQDGFGGSIEDGTGGMTSGSGGMAIVGTGGTTTGSTFPCTGHVPSGFGGGAATGPFVDGSFGVGGGGGVIPVSATCVSGESYCSILANVQTTWGNESTGRCKPLGACVDNPTCACVAPDLLVNCRCSGTDDTLKVVCDQI